jgi:hypothetical protein
MDTLDSVLHNCLILNYTTTMLYLNNLHRSRHAKWQKHGLSWIKYTALSDKKTIHQSSILNTLNLLKTLTNQPQGGETKC